VHSWRWSSRFNQASAIVDVQIRKGAGKEAELCRMVRLTMRIAMASKKLKRLSFQRQFEALKRASWSERGTTT
jgi:hypothetical protein